jgi:hypothetical protein
MAGSAFRPLLGAALGASPATSTIGIDREVELAVRRSDCPRLVRERLGWRIGVGEG